MRSFVRLQCVTAFDPKRTLDQNRYASGADRQFKETGVEYAEICHWPLILTLSLPPTPIALSTFRRVIL
jgi:hypothetical protein